MRKKKNCPKNKTAKLQYLNYGKGMIKQPFQGARKAASLSPGRVYFRKAGHVCVIDKEDTLQ